MSRPRISLCVLAMFLGGASASAQQRSIFDPDDFVSPHQHQGAVFISRLVAGAAKNFIDDYRPLHQDAGFLHLTNSVYWSRFEFDYKHSEVHGKNDNGPIDVQKCRCQPPIYFPTPRPREATPAAPYPNSKDTVQLGWYHTRRRAFAEPPIVRRYRLSVTRQEIDTVILLPDGEESRISGREWSFGFDADTYFRIAGHDVYGSLVVARAAQSGTTDNRRQTELTYKSRFPGWELGQVLVRATLTFGGVTGRGAGGLNVINPAFEAFWHSDATEANVHFVYSPQSTRSGIDGWETHHQIAVFIDRKLYIRIFSPKKKAASRPPTEVD